MGGKVIVYKVAWKFDTDILRMFAHTVRGGIIKHCVITSKIPSVGNGGEEATKKPATPTPA